MNSVMMQAFEWDLPDDGKHYNRLKEKMADIAEAGIDSLWLPPFCKGGGSNDVGYGNYDFYDLGEFDQKGTVRTKYGTKEELLAMIEEAHKYGVRVYADVVLNHKSGADETEVFKVVEVDPMNRNVDLTEPYDIEAWTKFTFPGRNGKYSDFIWTFQHFNGVDYDVKADKNGIFKILGENKGWAYEVSGEKGNYDYLMNADIDHAHPDVQDELLKWIQWLIDTTKIDGIRIDAAKHIDGHFIERFISDVRDYVDDDFYVFGEYWVADPQKAGHYLYETDYQMDLFDVGLHFNMKAASDEGGYYDMRKIFENSVVDEYPMAAVTFVDNHDTQEGQSLQSNVGHWFLPIAYGLILLRQDGYPCIFYRDYYGYFGKENHDLKEKIDVLLEVRKNYGHGEQTDYFQGQNEIGWVRHGTEDKPGKLAVAISNGEEKTVYMELGKDQAGKIFYDYTGQVQEKISLDDKGNGEFIAPAGSIACWVEDN